MPSSEQAGQMTELTPLEAAVFHHICETDTARLSADQRGTLRAQLATARVVDRDNTGHGFYTTIEVDRSAAPKWDGERLAHGPAVRMHGLGEGNMLGFILWLEHGYAHVLEAFQYGDRTGQTVNLREHDLSRLRFDPVPDS
ncbi:hypothetical protein [Oceanicella sp. SM1341]|uniref:hypothetical protein n=1 Tax=Oceanicella sp. SM1341 TaxID=1548889 RepID=UPI00130063E4|nr:hypothetical protein [Oceanicella sp. SM1341]